MFAAFLGLTILGDCVSAVPALKERAVRGRSFMVRKPVPTPLQTATDFQLLNPLTVVLSPNERQKRQRLEGSVYDLA